MKNKFDGWNSFEIIFLTTGILLAIISTLLVKSDIINLVYTLSYFIAALLLAKGKYSCYILIIISTFFYAYVSYQNNYYGEIIIAMLMTLPMAIYGLINWLKHQDNEKTVLIKQMTIKELIILIISQLLMFYLYYAMLRYFNTNNLLVSTISIIVSFFASYCTARRSDYGFMFYILDDLILIVLWSMLLFEGNPKIISILICPVLLLINDCYGAYNWKKIYKKQTTNLSSK